jgi:hypothetical protein
MIRFKIAAALRDPLRVFLAPPPIHLRKKKRGNIKPSLKIKPTDYYD